MYQLTDEDRMKKAGKKNPGTSIINSIKNRVHCNEKCRIFWICPLMPLSISRENVDTACLLNKGGNALIRRFVNVFVKGEEGLRNEIDSVLYSYGMDIETAPAGIKKDYAMMLMNWHKQQYSDPTKNYEQKPNLTVVINEMTREGKCITVPVVPVVEAGGINNSKNDIAFDRMLKESLEEDEETLLNSPILDEIMSDVPTHPKNFLSASQRGTTKGQGGRFVRKEGYVPIKERGDVSEQDHRTEDDESSRTEGEPEELAKASVSASGGTEWRIE